MNIPLMIDLTDKLVVIIGGGNVAYKRAKTLLNYCQHVHIVSPEINNSLNQLNQQNKITWAQKYFEPSDVEGAFLVIAATDNPEVNQHVKASLSPNTLFNDVGKSIEGNTTFPSILQRGRLSISVSTQGASPSLGKQITENLARTYDKNYEDYIEFLYESRQLIKQMNIEPSVKQNLLKEILKECYFDKQSQNDFLRWLRSQVDK